VSKVGPKFRMVWIRNRQRIWIRNRLRICGPGAGSGYGSGTVCGSVDSEPAADLWIRNRLRIYGSGTGCGSVDLEPAADIDPEPAADLWIRNWLRIYGSGTGSGYGSGTGCGSVDPEPAADLWIRGRFAARQLRTFFSFQVRSHISGWNAQEKVAANASSASSKEDLYILFNFKGTLTRDFRPLFFSSNNFLWVPDTQVKAFSNMASNSWR
jgi:hypothetical protein